MDGDGLRSRAGDLVYGLARGRGGRGRGPIRDGPGRGHVGKPGDRLLGDRAGGRGAPRVAASGGGGAVSATVYSDCRRDRDARLFEGVIAAVDDLVPRAELLRPGLLVLPVRGPARFSGPSRWRPSG